MNYECKCCHYQSYVKANYMKHLNTQKHILKIGNVTQTEVAIKSINDTEEDNPKSPKSQPKVNGESTLPTHVCKYCDQSFKFKQSMYRHIKYSCMKNKDEDLKELVRLLNLQLQHKDKQIETQARQIEKLMGKLEINGSFNNNTINHFTLLAYRDTDISHLTNEDYRNCYKKVNHCVKHLIEKVHFNQSKPENMNIYISNMKDKYLMVYDGFNWNLANKVEELDRLYEEKEMMLEEWLDSNPEPILKEKFMKYLNNKESDECLNHIKEEIKLMLYNKGNQLIKES